jgi:hypothetical protein
MPKVTNNSENISKCICGKCPSYNTCGQTKKELLFCAIPLKSLACSYQKNGCVCGECPIYSASKLTNGYYCIFGSADEIDK